MNQYLLLLHETPTDYSKLPPADLQRIIEEYSAWAQAMTERGVLLDGKKLTDDGGRLMTRSETGLEVVDGPYLEAKEIIGGFFMIQAEDFDQAVELVSSCPHLSNGGRVEMRQVDVMGDPA